MHSTFFLPPRVILCASFLGLLTIGSMAGGTPPSAETFFRPPRETGAELPAVEVYPKGRIFPFSFFSTGGNFRGHAPLPEDAYQAVLRRGREHGVTMIGPQYGLNERILADARDHGLKAIYEVSMPRAAVRAGELSPEQIVTGIREQVLRVAGDEEIAWWYVKPEELRYWRRSEIEYLEIAANTIRETDPLRRPVWMYDPGHRNAAALAHTARHLDIVGKGMYTNYSGMRDQRVWCRWTIEQQIEAIAAANPGAIPIAVPEMFQQPDPDEMHLIPVWVRHDAYCALVAGAKGIVIFSGRVREGFDAHETYFSNWLRVARELCGEQGLGQVFLFGERKDDLAARVAEGPETVEMVFPSGGVREPITYPSVSWADLAYGGDRYLFIVNSSPEAVVAEVHGLPAKGVRVENLFGEDPRPEPEDGRFRIAMNAWGVRAFRFSPRP